MEGNMNETGAEPDAAVTLGVVRREIQAARRRQERHAAAVNEQLLGYAYIGAVSYAAILVVWTVAVLALSSAKPGVGVGIGIGGASFWTWFAAAGFYARREFTREWDGRE